MKKCFKDWSQSIAFLMKALHGRKSEFMFSRVETRESFSLLPIKEPDFRFYIQDFLGKKMSIYTYCFIPLLPLPEGRWRPNWSCRKKTFILRVCDKERLNLACSATETSVDWPLSLLLMFS